VQPCSDTGIHADGRDRDYTCHWARDYTGWQSDGRADQPVHCRPDEPANGRADPPIHCRANGYANRHRNAPAYCGADYRYADRHSNAHANYRASNGCADRRVYTSDTGQGGDRAGAEL
jgi:hypothetical protein